MRSISRPIRPLLPVALAVAALLACPAGAAATLFDPDGSFGSELTPGGHFVDVAGVATDDAGRVYVADRGAGRVEVYDRAADGNAFLRTIGDEVLDCPVGVRIDNRGRIYVSDACRDVVVMFDSYVDGAPVRREFGGGGTELGRMSVPRFLAVDDSARVYVAERGNVRIQTWRPSGGRQVPVAAFGVADPPTFLAPEGVARNGDGRLYVSDDSESDGEVRVYDRRGLLLGTVATPGAGSGQVSAPRGLLRDPLGRLLVIEAGNARIQAFSSFATGHQPLEAFGGGAFVRPADASLAPGALLYVTDPGSGTVVRLRYDDADRDGALDERDNCPGLENPAQADTDRDGAGDACDGDDDNDGVGDGDDRCPRTLRGVDANQDGCGDPRSRISAPRDRKSFNRRRPPTRVSGTAGADELGVERVEVALAKVVGGGCRWWTGTAFGAATSCESPAWVAAEGTERWVARVRLRARGTYRVRSRALQAGGLAESVFDRRNQRSFRVR
jgi:DNA-binding beta-propeller fold protein YncE